MYEKMTTIEVTKTKITLTIASVIALVGFFVSGTVYFLNIKNECDKRITAVEQQMKNFEDKLIRKAEVSEIDKINIKLASIEALLLELKQDIKEMK